MNQHEDIYTFHQAANNLSILSYNPNKMVDGRYEIGKMMADDNSVFLWSIIMQANGYVLEITPVYDGINDDGKFIPATDTKPVYMIPYSDEIMNVGKIEIKTFKEIPKITFDTVEEAFDTFKDVVYASKETELLYNLEQEAATIIGDYIDAKNSPFLRFKKAFHNACVWSDYSHTYTPTRLANAMLAIRYPFLIPWEYKNEPWREDEHFAYTSFTSIPDGWAKRFGLEMCEDLRNQAYDEDERIWTWRLCNMRPDQIKEKFGGLRWYGTTYGKGSRLIDAYEHISYNVCINCGRSDNLRITTGWISPICWTDVLRDDKNSNEKHAEYEERYLSDVDNPSWEERYAAWKIGEYNDAIRYSKPADTAEDITKILTNWEWRSYSNEGEQTINEAVGLLDGTPAPNGEPVWARQVIQEIAAEITSRINEPIEEEIKKSMDVIHVGEDDMLDWWNTDTKEEY